MRCYTGNTVTAHKSLTRIHVIIIALVVVAKATSFLSLWVFIEMTGFNVPDISVNKSRT